MGKNRNRNRKVDKLWVEIFKDYKIMDKLERYGFFEITSSEIKKYREPRLMTKFDHKNSLPDIFFYNKLSILPNTRGSYIISHFNAYQKLKTKPNNKPKKISMPYWIETIDYDSLYSEASVINCAYVTGIFNEIMQEKVIFPTVSGRMSTSVFDFNIDNVKTNKKYNFYVKNSQCEIDGGYEGLNKLMLLEAKNTLSDDFLIRQLYFPYRLWHQKIKGVKPITPVFLVYSAEVFHFFVYNFEDVYDYNSLQLLYYDSFTIEDEIIRVIDIEELLDEVSIVKEPTNVPFPQADTFERVLDLLGALYEEDQLSSEDISLRYDFTDRQADYYTNACKYLGLADKQNGAAWLTKKGKKILSMKKRERLLSITKCILNHEVFYLTLSLYLKTGRTFTKEEIYQKITKPNEHKLYNISGDTVKRRTQSVKKWVEWVIGLAEE
ncbi:MAG: type II restriction enzyme [bacterium]